MKIIQNIINLHQKHQINRKYATAVFLSTNRFDLNKKKLGHVTFDQLVECSSLIMKYWTDAGKLLFLLLFFNFIFLYSLMLF